MSKPVRLKSWWVRTEMGTQVVGTNPAGYIRYAGTFLAPYLTKHMRELQEDAHMEGWTFEDGPEVEFSLESSHAAPAPTHNSGEAGLAPAAVSG